MTDQVRYIQSMKKWEEGEGAVPVESVEGALDVESEAPFAEFPECCADEAAEEGGFPFDAGSGDEAVHEDDEDVGDQETGDGAP